MFCFNRNYITAKKFHRVNVPKANGRYRGVHSNLISDPFCLLKLLFLFHGKEHKILHLLM